MRKAGFLLASLVLLLSVVDQLNISPVSASTTIYIRADGSIDPPTAPISSTDNITYTFTGNVYDSIVVERGNIIIDGNGFTLQGSGSGNGFDFFHNNNVTIQNTTIRNFRYGIELSSSPNNTICGNTIANNLHGIQLDHSSNNTIQGNNITTNEYDGIWAYDSSYNCISGNTITATNDVGVVLESSPSNCISGNKLANNGLGIRLKHASNSSITGNTFINNGLLIYPSSYQNFVENNSVNGRPLVYLEEASNLTVDEAGQVILVRCENIRVEGLNLSSASFGLELWETSNCTIFGNTMTNNSVGIVLYWSDYNNIQGNNIAFNSWKGIQIQFSSYNRIQGNSIANNYYSISLADVSNYNSICHNNFLNNTMQAYGYHLTNFWDDGCEGNCWSDYSGSDLDGDGIGDTPYVIDENNTDRFPLMSPYWNPGDINHDLAVDIFDAVLVCDAYGATPSDPHWNCHCDIAESYGVVDLFDAVLMAVNYGEEYHGP